MDESKIKLVMATVLEMRDTDINDESNMDNVETWDSLRHMNFILALEEEFNVSIPDDEVGTLTSYTAVKQMLSRLTAENS